MACNDYTSAGVCLPDKKTLPRLEGFSFEPKQLKQTKKTITTGTKIGVLLLMIRKSKT